MRSKEIIYTQETATSVQIEQHLVKCDNNYIPKLSDRTNIKEYANKLHNKSYRQEAWINDDLIGLIAFYINKIESSAFITNVSILEEYAGKGIASTLLNKMKERVVFENIKNIYLEVGNRNQRAINFYEKNGFIQERRGVDNIKMKYKII